MSEPFDDALSCHCLIVVSGALAELPASGGVVGRKAVSGIICPNRRPRERTASNAPGIARHRVTCKMQCRSEGRRTQHAAGSDREQTPASCRRVHLPRMWQNKT
jgi:hypothetical protein